VGGGWSDGMRVVIHKNGMLEMSIINVIFLTNVEKWGRVLITSLLACVFESNYSRPQKMKITDTKPPAAL